MGVGQLLGKLFGAADDGTVPLHAYGKLPLYAEYRRLDITPGTPTQFSQWMDAGRLAWVRSLETGGTLGVTQASRMLLQLPDAKEVVIASLWDSRDSLGRVFPFSFFVVCPREALGATLIEQWITAGALFTTFDSFHSQLSQLGSGGNFYALYKSRRLEVQLEDLSERVHRAQRDASALDIEDWFARTAAGQGEIDPGTWFGMLSRRGKRWSQQPEVLGELALSLPLGGGAGCDAQSLTWLRWLEPLRQKLNAAPSLITRACNEREPAALHVIFRPLLEHDFQLLTTDAAKYKFAENLTALPENGDTPADPVTPPTGSLLEWAARTAPQPQ